MATQMRLARLAAILLILTSSGAFVQTTQAATAAAVSNTYTVNSTNDVDDGSCNVTHCSFREAINAANNHTGSDTIVFNFSSAAAILPTSELPAITDPVIIDAVAFSTAQCASSGAGSDLEISLSGFFAGDASGLVLGSGSSGSTIKGLAIVLWAEYGIEVFSDNNIIRCNHIGLDAHGNVDLGNGLSGVVIDGDNNTVGGDSIDDRNVISGNGQAGVLVDDLGDFNLVAGNYIGTKADGVSPLGNSLRGVGIYGDNNTIGGLTANERNIIAANGLDGIWLHDIGVAPTNNIIINNYIGADKNGAPLGNGDNGVWILEGSGNTVGNSSAPNLIAYNGQNGIRVGQASIENALRVNSIHDNDLLGIDLEGAGEASGDVTYNDLLDSDTGANQLQNYPILNSADVTGRIQGTLAGPPGDDISLFFYINDSCDDSGYGEGKQFRQAVDVTIPGGGILFLDTTLAAPLAAGKYVVATAIDISTENTSEFSNCVQVTAATFVVDSTGNVADANPGDGLCDVTGLPTDCTLRAAISEIEGSASNGPFRIEFNIPGTGPHVITPPNDFDDITKPVTIDGTSQPGSTCPVGSTPANLQIVLNGSTMTGTFSGNGLTLAAGSGSSEIRGLVIGGFPEQGIQIDSNNNVVACNHIGVDAAGTTDFGNALNGIRVNGANNRIGGQSSSERNVIGGNGVSGVLLNTGAAQNKVQGNFVGTNAAGNAAIGNTEAGIRLNTATGNRIGGTVGTARNVISGNGLYGIQLRAASTDNEVWGNRVGTDRTGTTAIPNPDGIFVRNSNGNELGGDTPEKGNLVAGNSSNGLFIDEDAFGNLVQYNAIGLNAGSSALGNGIDGIRLGQTVSGTQIVSNTIAYNVSDGVRIVEGNNAIQNTIRQNAIYTNGDLGIGLGGNGVDGNDSGDNDGGSNGHQNYPVLVSTPGSFIFTATLDSRPNLAYLVDVYRSPSCDPSGFGEGELYLMSKQVTTTSSGQVMFDLDLTGLVFTDTHVTATATDPGGNTSEFSSCATVTVAGGGYTVLLPLVLR